ncbi:MAG TPA: glycosyltransferase [Acidobacteriota bacterium]|nr:glycosyltransferase [Acidobacteriota bacterium]
MRIFLAIPRSPNAAFDSDLWKRNLHDPLVALGHDVVLFHEGVQPLFDLDPGAPATAEPRARFEAGFRAAVEEADRAGRLELIVTYFSDSHLTNDAIGAVRTRIAPVVNFFCNNVHQFHLVRRSARAYTGCLVPEEAALASYRAAGAEPIFFPMAAHPEVYRPLDLPQRYEATFAGQRYGDRTGGILALREAGVDAHAFGQGWTPAPAREGTPGAAGGGGAGGAWTRIARAASLVASGRNPLAAAADVKAYERLRARHAASLHPIVDDDAYVRLFSESAISLGFLILGDTHRTARPLRQIRLREFEAPMAGAFYVTGFLEEIGRHYEIGREIVCYRSLEEMTEQCRYYLAHPDERERIRRAGHDRARRDHTWTRRFEDLFADLKRRGVVRG